MQQVSLILWSWNTFSHVSELVLGDNIFDLDFGFHIDSVKEPIKRGSVRSRHVSHRRTSSLNYHFDHGFVVFTNVQLRFIVRRMCVGGHIVHITLPFLFDFLGLGFGLESHQVPG